MLYFLSLGPVMRSFAKVTSQASNMSATGFSISRTVAYPFWVGVVYYPAFCLAESGVAGGFYQDYIDWWMEAGTQN